MPFTFKQSIKKAASLLLSGGKNIQEARSMIPPITAAEVADARLFFPMDKFFIFGHARSGTTLLARLIRLHPEVFCNWQAHFFTRPPYLKSLVNTKEVEEWLGRKSNRWNNGRDLSPLVLRAAADFILERDAIKEHKRITGDKSPSSLVAGEAVRDMAAVYPDARMIYIVRDGRDVIISERMRNFIEGSRFLTGEDKRIMDDILIDPRPYFNGEKSIFTETFIRYNAGTWRKNLLETEAEGRKLYPDRFHSLRYEDLLAEPVLEMEKIWNFLGAGHSPHGLDEIVRHEMTLNPDEEWQKDRNEAFAAIFAKGKTGNWRGLFTPRDRAVFHQTAGEMLIKWNYEQNGDWV